MLSIPFFQLLDGQFHKWFQKFKYTAFALPGTTVVFDQLNLC